MYRNGAGALVFSSSSFRWSHGLDDARSTGIAPSGVGLDMQQATINILADMNVQPGSLRPGLLPALASTDQTAPVSQITALNHATGVAAGVASDVGGVVGASRSRSTGG